MGRRSRKPRKNQLPLFAAAQQAVASTQVPEDTEGGSWRVTGVSYAQRGWDVHVSSGKRHATGRARYVDAAVQAACDKLGMEPVGLSEARSALAAWCSDQDFWNRWIEPSLAASDAAVESLTRRY